MSTDGRIGRTARADRTAVEELTERDRIFANRCGHLATVLVTAFAAVPLLWVGQERATTTAKLQVEVAATEPAPSIPLHVNEQVERWLTEFRTARSDEFYNLLARRGVFQDMIRGKLRERRMPEELLYLAMIESGLSPRAVSRVSAVGLWQFMSPTAMQFGLRVDEYVDERRDPVRATDAALDYIDYLHDRFGSWYLAAAAYNAGPGRVQRVLSRHAEGRTGDEELYWEVLRFLPRETREYVPRLVAMALLAAEAEARGDEIPTAEPYEYDNVFVPGETDLRAVAESLGVEPSVLRDLNPHLTKGVTPPDEMYGVRVPRGGIAAVVASLGSPPPGRIAD